MILRILSPWKKFENPYLIALSFSSVKLHDSIQEEAEFEGDPTLEIISDEKLKELEQPAWAKKIMSCVQPIGTNLSMLSFSRLICYRLFLIWRADEILQHLM